MLPSSLVDREPQNEIERDLILSEQRKQLIELGSAMNHHITCPCGNSIPISLAFKCFYCWIWFCRNCAERHFESSSRQP